LAEPQLGTATPEFNHGLTNTELARGTFVSRQAMHQLLHTLKSLNLVQGDGGGRHERYSDSDQRRRLRADLIACATELNS
jgi:hypothetical protein